ncbi:hypothetical protein [Microvirga sp. VF16]|uniref:DUF6894 family protein n=1 Tax=Microvirga sp. VF16 TaxID=2807101 RepID=UPI00352FFAB7
MQRYYFNLTDGYRLYLDSVGVVLVGPAAVRQHALEDARVLLESWMARSALPWRVEVHDSLGTIVCSIALADAAVSEARPLSHSGVESCEWTSQLLECAS